MATIDRFQGIRTNLHLADQVRFPAFDRYDSIMPRPGFELFHWHAMHHHEDPVRSPISAPLSGLGSGGLYRPVTPPDMRFMDPAPVIWRNGRWERKCDFFGPAGGCDYSSPSGVDLLSHMTMETIGGRGGHLSPNDRPALLGGVAYDPAHWFRYGRVTDVSGRRALLQALGRKPQSIQGRRVA